MQNEGRIEDSFSNYFNIDATLFLFYPTNYKSFHEFRLCNRILFAKAFGGLAGLRLGGDLQAAGLGHVQLLPQVNTVLT